jgi:glutaredoxin-like YruB-family protein
MKEGVIMGGKKVEIYSLPTCPHCKKAKEYLANRGVSYIDYDVGKDREKADEMIRKSGQTGAPVILVDDEMVIGFNESRLAQLLSS